MHMPAQKFILFIYFEFVAWKGLNAPSKKYVVNIYQTNN